MEIQRVIIAMVIAASITSLASAIPGIATFYTTYVPSACYGFQDQGTMIAAVNPSLYNNGTACGRIYRIRCAGATNPIPPPCRTNVQILVRIVDVCTRCGFNQLDLSQEAFSRIGNPDAGRIIIDYTPV